MFSGRPMSQSCGSAHRPYYDGNYLVNCRYACYCLTLIGSIKPSRTKVKSADSANAFYRGLDEKSNYIFSCNKKDAGTQYSFDNSGWNEFLHSST